MSIVNNGGGHLHGGDHFVESVNCSMSLIPKLRGAASITDNGGVGIGDGDTAAVHGSAPGILPFAIKPSFQLPIAFVEVFLERMGINDRVVGGISIDETRVHEDLRAVDQSRLHALHDDPFEEMFEGSVSPSLPCLGENTVIRHG